jgi:hypothetical protein
MWKKLRASARKECPKQDEKESNGLTLEQNCYALAIFIHQGPCRSSIAIGARRISVFQCATSDRCNLAGGSPIGDIGMMARNRQDKLSRNDAWIGSKRSAVRRSLAVILAAFGIGVAIFPANSALADEGDITLPSGDFMMSASFCSLQSSNQECEYWNYWGYWIFNSDGSTTKESYDGWVSPDQATWSAVGPERLFTETYSAEGYWLSSVLVERVSGGTGGEYPCYEGVVNDLDIGVVAIRLCLEP